MGMKSPAKKKEIVKRSRPTDAELGKIDSNNGDAGKIISALTAGHKSIEYEARDIALYDIRVNADNEIFRQADTQEDIVQLAEDIQRNGLMHNLVVFPQEENGKTVYVLLSGERRYRAMVFLDKRVDAKYIIPNIFRWVFRKMKKRCFYTVRTCRCAAALRMNKSAARPLQNLWSAFRTSRSI